MKKYLFLALVAFLAVTSASAQLRIKMGKNSPIEKLGRAEIAITNLYVDSVDENKLVEDAIRGMLEKLDPHSSYTTAKETKAMNEPLNGSFDGIGVQFNMVDDSLLVIQPVTNGPSEKVGIIAGDRIVAVNDTAISGVKMSKEEIMKRLRGPKGTTVNLTIVRRGIKDKLTFKVKRDKIPVTTMDAAYMIRPGIGYIRLGSFGLTSHKEVTMAMDSLKKKGMKDLIFDLEDNGGGYLQTAAQIANEFLEKGDLIVYTSGRAAPRQEYKAQANGRETEGCAVSFGCTVPVSAAYQSLRFSALVCAVFPQSMHKKVTAAILPQSLKQFLILQQRIVQFFVDFRGCRPRVILCHTALYHRLPSIRFVIEYLFRIENGIEHLIRIVVCKREAGALAGKLVVRLYGVLESAGLAHERQGTIAHRNHLCQTAQNAGDDAAEEQLTGGNAADTGNDHHGDGRRNDDADGGGNGGDSNGEVLGVALAHHFRHEHTGNACGIGNSGTGDARKDHAGQHIHMSQTAVDVADDGVAEIHQALGNAALGHGEAGKGVQRDGQQCKAVHALKHALGNGDGAAAAQEQDASTMPQFTMGQVYTIFPIAGVLCILSAVLNLIVELTANPEGGKSK